MSKIFFDHLIEIEEIKICIDDVCQTHEEKIDLWDLVDEYINNKVIFSILNELDESSHDEFITMFLNKPYDLEIVNYLNSKLKISLEELLMEAKKEMLRDIYTMLEISEDKDEKQIKRGKKVTKT